VIPEIFPVVDFDPVAEYIEHIEKMFGEYAMFFYNKHGHCDVGVLWRPNINKPRPFKIATSACMSHQDNKGQVTLNVATIIQDFEVMGRGLVDSIYVKS